jgi:predicted DNA-binding transcriptional regulator YafY
MSEALLRHFECLKFLSRDRKKSATEIHRHLEDRGHKVSKRTVERDLQMLSTPFGLVSDERNKPFGWKYADSVSVSLFPGLSETEALSFLMLKQFSKRLLPTSIAEDLDPYFKNASRKLSDDVSQSAVRKWPSKVRIVEPNQPLVRPQIDPQVQKEVYAALFRDKQIRITYLPPGRKEAREYSPVNLLGLVEHGPVLYLVVTFLEYGDIRILALHRIKSATMLKSHIKQPANFDLDIYIASGAFGFGGDEQRIKLEIHFFNGAGLHLLETQLSEDQTVREIDESALAITASVRNTRRLHWWLLGFGADVEVIGPAHLREDIRQSLATASSRYE